MGAIRCDSTSWVPNAILCGNAGFGVLASEVVKIGTNGKGYLANDVTLPAQKDIEVSGRIKRLPTKGVLSEVGEDGSFIYTKNSGASGVDSMGYWLYAGSSRAANSDGSFSETNVQFTLT